MQYILMQLKLLQRCTTAYISAVLCSKIYDSPMEWSTVLFSKVHITVMLCSVSQLKLVQFIAEHYSGTLQS